MPLSSSSRLKTKTTGVIQEKKMSTLAFPFDSVIPLPFAFPYMSPLSFSPAQHQSTGHPPSHITSPLFLNEFVPISMPSPTDRLFFPLGRTDNSRSVISPVPQWLDLLCPSLVSSSSARHSPPCEVPRLHIFKLDFEKCLKEHFAILNFFFARTPTPPSFTLGSSAR